MKGGGRPAAGGTSVSRGMTLPAPREKVDLLVLAGEHSGDEHAARLLEDLRAVRPGVRVAAIGGEKLRAAGAELLFDLTEHSVIGIAEVLKHYGFFKDLFREVTRWVGEHRPRTVLLVDYPGFNLRLAAELKRRGISRKGGGPVAVHYYIAPQVWAWKGKRRFAMAETLDSLACILPFEVPFFADTTLPVRFVGHPFVAAGYEPPLRYDPAGPILLLPGSRVQPVRQVFPVQLAAFAQLAERRPEARAEVIYPSERVAGVLREILGAQGALAGRVTLRPNAGTAGARAVLMSSGTMSLSCAMAGVPGAIVQRVHPLTYALGRALVKVPYLGLANLLLNRPAIPEYIQKVDTHDLSRELERCLTDPDRREAARAAAEELRGILSPGGEHPAGQWLAAAL